MRNLIQTENPGLVRDPHSRALLANDRSKVDDYTARKNMFKQAELQKAEINTLKVQVSELNTKLDTITELLQKVLDK